MHRLLLVTLTSVAMLAACVTVTADDKDEKKKFTVKEVMKKAFKGDLGKKVKEGKAKPEEVDLFISMIESMQKAKPKKGDAKSWKEKTDALLSAAKGVKGGTKGAKETLAKAMNCKACHSKHK